MKFSTANQEHLLKAALAGTHSTGWASDARAFACINGDTIEAIAVFQRFDRGAADVHVAALVDKPTLKSIVAGILGWGFNHPLGAKLNQMRFRIAADNRRTQIAAMKIGAEFEYRERAGFDGVQDAIILTLTPDGARAAATGAKLKPLNE